MNVRIEVRFEQPTADDKNSLRRMAGKVTDDRKSVKVFAKPDDADWLVAEFTMSRQAQHLATAQIERSIEFQFDDGRDFIIYFLQSEDDRRYAKRKADRRRANRAAQRSKPTSDEPKRRRK